MKFLLILGLGLLVLRSADGQERQAFYNVRTFGAKGDGATLDTAAINKAIDAAHSAGGGTVFFPAGTYESGSIHLESHVGLYLDQGATLEATANPDAYDAAEPNQWDKYQDFGHSHFHNSLMWGEDLEDVAILGPGLIHGTGLTRQANQRVGNKAISIKRGRNIIIRDISMLMCGHFAILVNGVDNLTIDNLKIDTNRDGMDIDNCRNVRISNCSVNSPSDDGICLKSDYALGEIRSVENVTITNCQVSGYDRGTFLNGTYKTTENVVPDRGGPTGRIKFGTESNGGFKNITIANSVFDHCRGFALESVDGAHLEDVTISNIAMRDIVDTPFFIRLGARMRGPEDTPVGCIRRINISNVTVYNADVHRGSIITGIPGHPIEDLKLNNIRIYYAGGGTQAQAQIAPPEKETAYPDPLMFTAMPSYGFFIRHVRNIEMNNVQVSYLKDDVRPPFVLDDVTGAEFNQLKAEHMPSVPTFALKNIKDFSIYRVRGLADTHVDNAAEKQF